MEILHHQHVEVKGAKEYLFEFLMIFLAVTTGFKNLNRKQYCILRKILLAC